MSKTYKAMAFRARTATIKLHKISTYSMTRSKIRRTGSIKPKERERTMLLKRRKLRKNMLVLKLRRIERK